MDSKTRLLCQWNIFSLNIFPLKTFSSFKSRFINMITICFVSLNLSIPWLDASQLPFKLTPRTVQALHCGRRGEDGVWFTRCVEGKGPEIYELWTFTEDRTRKVHPFARIQISDNFTGKTFHTDFVSEKGGRVAFLDRRPVNRSVEWLDVP